MNLIKWWKNRKQTPPAAEPEPKHVGLHRALARLQQDSKPAKTYNYPIKAPELPKGVIPDGATALVAKDSSFSAGAYEFAQLGILNGSAGFVGFPGYPYLSMLSARAEYRMFAQAISSSLTREWLVLNSTDTAGDETKSKITELTQLISDVKLRETIALMAEHDSFFGKAQMYLNIEGADREIPLVINEKTIPRWDGKKGKMPFSIKAVEPMWTTPSAYNAIDPTRDDFYVPTGWFVLGKITHATRLLTIITRPVADILKPAFNFGGMPESQLAEPYVDNWLRTRQSVSDLISNFSVVAFKTDMGQILQGDDNGADLMKRIDYFCLTRSNKGALVLDKEREEFEILNVPLSGLAELQSQSQEQMCSVSHTPAVILLGIAPSGFGNVAEGELRAYYDWVASIQERWWRKPIETVINILQIMRWGAIDPDIVITWQPLYQMTPKELSEIRKSDADIATAYTAAGILDPIEIRESLARNPESGFQGIDITKIPDGGEIDPDEGTPEGGQTQENEDVP